MPDTSQHPNARNRYIGALLGQAIGDALGLPANGLSRAQIAERFGAIEDYQPLTDGSGQTIQAPGQYSSGTELAMCLAEGVVTSNGFIDPELVGYRFLRVLHSEHAALLDPATRTALEHAEATGDFQSGGPDAQGSDPGPAVRVTPVALVHALSDLNPEVFVREVMRSTLITSASPEAVNGALASAYATRLVLRREVPPEILMDEVLAFIDEDNVAQTIRKAKRLYERSGPEPDIDALLDTISEPTSMEAVVAAALYLFTVYATEFRTAVLAAANIGGETAAVAALTGALAGAHLGAEAIPVDLVDGLEGRMYVLMAAPAILRVAQMRAGLFYHLHQA